MDTFDEFDHLDHFSIDLNTNVADDLKSSFTSTGLQTNTVDLENMFLEMDNEDPERILDFIEMENEDRSLSTPTHDNRASTTTTTTSHAAARPLKKRKTRTNSRRRVSTSSDNMESCFFSRAWLGKIEHNEHNDVVDQDLLLCPKPFSTKRRRITPPSSPVTHQLIDCHISSMTDLRKLAPPPTRNTITTTTTSSECQTQFTEALRNLGASMKRSELSRRQINIQESVMTKVIRDNVMLNIEQQVQQATKWGVTISPSSSSSSSAATTTTTSAPCRHVTHPTTGEDITYRMEQFFNGSRGTLTDGLEESRKQLRMYA